jgi:hypothetical protein
VLSLRERATAEYFKCWGINRFEPGTRLNG